MKMDTFLQYLLNIKELTDEKKNGLLLEAAFDRVDVHRREKAAGMRPGRAQAASLGAGLLLQLALGDMQDMTGQQEEKSVRYMTEKQCAACRELKPYTVGRLLTRLESIPFFPVSYRYGDKGKPYFGDFPFYFSISHSGDYVLCVISEREIGADIQQWRKCPVKGVAERFFSDREQEALEREALEREIPELFFRLWTRKEAYGKLTGRGIGDAAGINLLPGREVLPEGRKLLWTEWQFREETQNPEMTGYSAAVCEYGGCLSPIGELSEKIIIH